MVKNYIESVKTGNFDVLENTKKVLEKCKEYNEEYHFFNVISEETALEQSKLLSNPKGKLAGLPVSIKDCICVKDVESTAGSRILKGYKPLFDATVVKRIKKEGGIIVVKTAQDEFGFGGFSTNVGLDYEVPLNPNDKERSCGGSSGGAAGIAKKADFPHISIAESTGGSIVNPAAFCGVVGLCPTYGRVSRNGLLDFANSLDKIGPIGKRVYDVALMLQVIAGHDEKDSTSSDREVDNYTEYVGKPISELKVGVMKESFNDVIDPVIQDAVRETTERLKSLGASCEEVTVPMNFNHGVPVYYLLAMSETSTNLAKYCGMRYGKHETLEGGFNEYFSKVRSQHFGKEVKRRSILGTFARMAGYRDAYYIKAAKIRTLMIQEYKKLFEKYDVLLSPVTPILAPKFEDINKMTPMQAYMTDQLTTGPNLCGMPHMSVNVGYHENIPVGVMLVADQFKEKNLIQVGSSLENGI